MSKSEPKQNKMNQKLLLVLISEICVKLQAGIQQMSSQLSRKITQQVRSQKCRKSNCKSQQKDNLQVVWFGKQYGELKEVTCSSCFICNDEALKAAIPTQLNILPVRQIQDNNSQFIEQFTVEMKQYEQRKNSKEYFPKVLREKGKQFIADLAVQEKEIDQVLKQLGDSIVNFTKKVQISAGGIFRHPIFEQLIVINNDDKFDQLLDKINILIGMLNWGADQAYHFEDLELREKKVAKLKQTISELSQKVTTVLKELLQTLKEKNEFISKL